MRAKSATVAAIDLLLTGATLKVRRQPRADVTPLFSPAAPGCTRKVDLPLAPGFKRARLRLKAIGTIDGRTRTDRDVLIVNE